MLPLPQTPEPAQAPAAVRMSNTPNTPNTPDTPLTNSPENGVDTDSGKSSCSPALLECSFDSGISVEVNNMQLHRRLKQCRRILDALERDKGLYQKLRDKLSKIVDKKAKHEIEDEQFCNVCCAEIEVTNPKSFVKCSTCNKRICRGVKCADWIPNSAQWECQLCHSSKESLAHTSSWVAEQMSFNQHKFIYPMRARSEIYIPISDVNDGSMHFESVSQIGACGITADQKLKIREYVEEVVANMLGGTSLNNAIVCQMSKSENYLELFYKYHAKLSNILLNMESALYFKALKGEDLPSILNGRNQSTPSPTHLNNNHNDFADISQTRLRQLIESIIAETLHLPHANGAVTTGAVSEVALDTRSNGGRALSLSNGGPNRRHRTEHYFEPKIYQDLLATAVLNKIVDKQGNGKLLSESTPDLSGHIVDPNYNVENASTTSGSSIEPRSDCSYTDNEQMLSKGDNIAPCDSELSPHSENLSVLAAGRESVLSDYIAGHMVPLPDFSVPLTESEEDDYASVTSSALGEGTWEDNWLFKKRSSMKTSVTSSSVGMLVPAPKEDIRAQIGDKTADEVSDLSELGSDVDDSSLDLLRGSLDPPNNRLLNKHLIGGQNTKLVLDELVDQASLVSTSSLLENENTFIETRNENIIHVNGAAQAINKNITTTNMSPTNIPSAPAIVESESSTLATTTQPLAGSIAEREHKKWNNAVEMPNNPYAPEALKRRISGSQERFIDLPNISPSTELNPIELIKSAKSDIDEEEKTRETDYKRYSRDYYINNGKQSTSSSPNHQCNLDTLTCKLGDDPPTDHVILKEAEGKNKTSAEPEKQPTPQKQKDTVPESDTFLALPAHVVEESTSLESISNQSLQSVHTTTSEDSDTVRIYDFKKQETTIIRETKPTTDTELPTTSEAPCVSPKKVLKKERPIDLQLSSVSTTSSGIGSPITPSRGSTPEAFKFLQPKRKLIEPSQILSIEEDEPAATTPTVEKPTIEREVVHVMPSVKALARAFLLTSKQFSQASSRSISRDAADTPKKPAPPPTPIKQIETNPSLLDATEDVTITSDLSSLETDPPTNPDLEIRDATATSSSPVTTTEATTTLATPTSAAVTTPGQASPVPVRRGVLKSNIAFFENLKFK